LRAAAEAGGGFVSDRLEGSASTSSYALGSTSEPRGSTCCGARSVVWPAPRGSSGPSGVRTGCDPPPSRTGGGRRAGLRGSVPALPGRAGRPCGSGAPSGGRGARSWRFTGPLLRGSTGGRCRLGSAFWSEPRESRASRGPSPPSERTSESICSLFAKSGSITPNWFVLIRQPPGRVTWTTRLRHRTHREPANPQPSVRCSAAI